MLTSISKPVSRLVFGRHNRVLMYHSIGGGLWDNISPAWFRRHLTLLTNHFEVVDLPEILEDDTPTTKVALTFDDGYADFVEHAVPILNAFEVPATVFLIGKTLEDPTFVHDDIVPHRYLSLDDARGLVDEPLISIGSHTFSHPDLAEISSRKRLEDEIKGGKELIEDELGVAIDRFAYPYNSTSPESREVVRESHSYGVCGDGEHDLITSRTDSSLIPRANGARRPSVILWRLADLSTKSERLP